MKQKNKILFFWDFLACSFQTPMGHKLCCIEIGDWNAKCFKKASLNVLPNFVANASISESKSILFAKQTFRQMFLAKKNKIIVNNNPLRDNSFGIIILLKSMYQFWYPSV